MYSVSSDPLNSTIWQPREEKAGEKTDLEGRN